MVDGVGDVVELVVAEVDTVLLKVDVTVVVTLPDALGVVVPE